MTRLSLDNEPLPKFEGKKEVNKKKNGTLHQIILSLVNEKTKSKFSMNVKRNEKKRKLNSQEYKLDNDYPRIEDSLEGKITSTLKSIGFTSTTDKDINNIIADFSYSQRRVNLSSPFYEFNYPYSFTTSKTFIKDNDKEKKYYSESKEQEEKETAYVLHAFEEEENIEDNSIKWNAKTYNLQQA